MSRRNPMRLRMDDVGGMEVVDPGWDSLDLLRAIDPGFEVRTAALADFRTPRFLGIRQTGCGRNLSVLNKMSEGRLWEIHHHAMERFRSGRGALRCGNEATILHLKIELAQRMLSHCMICGHRCGVDRIAGQKGICRLGAEAVVAEHFVHIGEEPPINPSLLVSLAGCGLRCRYCQQAALLDPAEVDGARLDASLWQLLDAEGARSLSFVGGNPDESLYAVLCFLLSAQEDWRLPIAWNCHGYAMPESLMLLDGVVDVWLPDFKYGDPICGWRLSRAQNYPRIALSAVGAMLSQNVPVIVRMLVLPGHLECCHIPVLENLAQLPEKEWLRISVRGQYCPDWQIGEDCAAMNRRPSADEVKAVQAKVEELGLMMVAV